MKKSIPILFLLYLLVPAAFAQDEQYEPMRETRVEEKKEKEDKKWDWSRARFGGNFGMQFGDIVYLDLSPSFGYYVIENKLQVGVGFKNIYYNQKRTYIVCYNGICYNSLPFKTYLYGPSVFVQYNVWKGLFIHGEYELINKEPYVPQRYPDRNRINVSHLLLGGGYTQPMGRAGNFYISLLYNVLDGDESIYTGTFGAVPLILRMGFGFGIAR